MDRRGLLAAAVLAAVPAIRARAATAPDAAARWRAVEAEARGQSVYFNAWGGDPAVNAYLAWAAAELARDHGLRFVHVKTADIAATVGRLLAERAAGRDRGGSVDLLWINGENFASLKAAGLLWGPWVAAVPNAALVDTTGNPTTVIDMTQPTAGYELAWGTSRFTIFYAGDRVVTPPDTPAALAAAIAAAPGRVTYPQPPDFIGTSFLKQLLLLLAPDTAPFYRAPAADAATRTQPLWDWLDANHGRLWRRGRAFPASGLALRRLLADGEVDIAMAFNPAEAVRAQVAGELPATIRACHFAGGALANSHFLAIPWNARARSGALVAANFLLSPRAQARKADVHVWGDPTVLALHRLPPADAALFAPAPAARALPAPPARLLAEPHPGWVGWLEQAWARRYLAG